MDSKYTSVRLDKKLVDELDELLPSTREFRSKSHFIEVAIKELMDFTVIKNSLNQSGQVYFKDLMRKKRIEAYNEAKVVDGKDYVYCSGQPVMITGANTEDIKTDLKKKK